MRGHVLDAETGAAIADVRLLLKTAAGRVENTAVSDTSGSFTLLARLPGDYTVEAVTDAYAAMPPAALRIEREQVVETELRLSRTVVTVEGLTVVARRRDPRDDRTFEGALARHERYSEYGFRRVFMRGDADFEAAFNVDELREFMPPLSLCRIVFWNGNLVHGREIADEWLKTPLSDIEAVEFYRRYNDAPLGLRAIPLSVRDPSNCTVIAMWQRLSPDPDRNLFPGWLRILGVAAAVAVPILVW